MKRGNSTVMNFCNFFKGQSGEVGCKELCQLNWHHKRLLYLLIFQEGHATQPSHHFAS